MSLCISYHIIAGENLLQLVRVYGSRSMSETDMGMGGGSAFDNGWTHVDNKQRHAHQITCASDSLVRDNRRVWLSVFARKLGRTVLPTNNWTVGEF